MPTRIQLADRLTRTRGSAAVFVMALALAAGCGGAKVTAAPAGSAEDAVRQLQASLEQGQYEAVWDGLPASYQADVTTIVGEFGQAMDADVWAAGKEALVKAVGLFRDQKEYVMGMAAQGAPMVGMDEQSYDQTVAMFDELLKSPLTDLDALRDPAPRALIADGLSPLLARLDENMPSQQDGMSPVPGVSEAFTWRDSAMSGRIVSSEVDGEVTRITMETDDGQETIEFVRVEEKWVPKDLADNWSEGVQEAREGIAGMKEGLQEGRIAAIGLCKAIGNSADTLSAAQSQEEFEAGYQQAMMGIMMAVMMGQQ